MAGPVIIITEKKWYVTNGLHYLGPYSTQEEAHAVRRRACPSGCVELLDPLASVPTVGLHGPLEPRYE